jgi:hypothetical protein
MAVEYDFPPEWGVMTHEERVEWHSARVDKETPVFEMLEEHGIMSCFEPDEIKVRLMRVRSLKKQVASALLVAENADFRGIWAALNAKVELAKQCIAERGRILNLQYRRPGFQALPAEIERLAFLKEEANRFLDEGEEIEGKIIDICDKFGTNPGPFMIVDPVRDLR